jgi:DNA-binding NarL/FixJ family response regulator
VIVLVVEDAVRVRDRLAALLRDVPGVADVVQAAGLAEALHALRARGPDLVVLDLHLNGESGLTFIPAVRRERPRAVVIVVTNDPSERHRRRSLAVGADHFFDKSREFESVMRIAAAAVGPTRAGRWSDS